MRRTPLPAVLLLALLTACGSTVQSASTAGGPTNDELAAPGSAAPGAELGGAVAPDGQPGDVATGPDGAPVTPGGAGGSVGGAPGAGAPAGTASGPGGTGGTDSAPGAAPRAATGPGVTDKEIRIGLSYYENAREAAGALGASGEGAGGGDGRRIWEIAVRSINDAGGVLGRKLVPVWHVFDATSSEPRASQEQAACETWTRDNKVFWVSIYGGETITACLHKAGVAQSDSALTDASTDFYAEHPYYVEAGMLQMDRVAASMPSILQSQGYFTKWDAVRGAPGGAQPVKVGILAFDDSRTKKAVRSILVPAVKRVVPGDPVVAEIKYPRSTAENADSISSTQAATLRFRDAGVTHVLPFETIGAGVGAFFAQGADQQKYYPRYGLTSGNGAQVLIDQGLWPKSQLAGALGFGWLPLVDLANADNPDNGPYSNEARRSCVALMVKGGVDVSAAITKRQAIESCNTVRLLKAAMERGGGAVHRDAWLAGVHALGGSFQSGLTFATRYSPAHHDGVAAVRPFAYTPGCGCFRYSGPTREIS